MILGEVCSRNCRFCGVPGSKTLQPPDMKEPEKVAEAVCRLELSWAVVTSVTRDDLPDYGAGHFARCVRMIHSRMPQCGVELLIPDFKGAHQALDSVIESGPQVIAHNVETVPRLYPEIRPEADYRRSLEVLSYLAKNANSSYTVKSSLMLGLGETCDEIRSVIRDLASAGCQAMTFGQYLPPSKKHLPVRRFYTPEEFAGFAKLAKKEGFARVSAGPLVRSSYQAHKLAGKKLHPSALQAN